MPHEFNIKPYDVARATGPHWCHHCDRRLSLREVVEQAGLCNDCYEGRDGWRPSPAPAEE